VSRGLLSDEDLAGIADRLPSLRELTHAILSVSPDLAALKFGPESRKPDAAVCLQDSLDMLAEAVYALHEYCAHRKWYEERRETAKPDAAVYFARFYLSDVALRLYAAAEHLAAAILAIMDLSEADLGKPKKCRTSLQARVGKHMRDVWPDHPLTLAVRGLDDATEWHRAMEFRNRWVHSQPPTVDGLGLVWRRGNRWEHDEPSGKWKLGVGGGAPPEYSVSDLHQFLEPAVVKFRDALASVADHYISHCS